MWLSTGLIDANLTQLFLTIASRACYYVSLSHTKGSSPLVTILFSRTLTPRACANSHTLQLLQEPSSQEVYPVLIAFRSWMSRWYNFCLFSFLFSHQDELMAWFPPNMYETQEAEGKTQKSRNSKRIWKRTQIKCQLHFPSDGSQVTRHPIYSRMHERILNTCFLAIVL